MTVAVELIYDKYEKPRNQAQNSNITEFQEWKNRIGMILEFTFCNSKVVACHNTQGQKKMLLFDNGIREQPSSKKKREKTSLPSTKIQIHDVSLEVGSIVFEILYHPDIAVFNTYLRGRKFTISECFKFSTQQYTNGKGKVIYESFGTHQNFLTGRFTEGDK